MKIWNWIKDNWWVVFLVIISAFLAVVVWHYLKYFNGIFPDSDACINSVNNDCKLDVFREKFSQIGDYFGGVLGAIFSFLSFIFLILTFQLNKTELSLSRDEFSKSAKALAEQAKILEIQKFESTFFSLLGQHNRLLDKITYTPPQPLPPNNLFYSYSSSVSASYDEAMGASSIDEAKEIILKEQDVSQYFRVLYQVLKFINTELNRDDVCDNFSQEKTYSSLVRSFLSNDVYYLLAINCYCKLGSNDLFYGYKRLLERYSFFEHMVIENDEYRIVVKQIFNHYESVAFGANQDCLDLKTFWAESL